MIQSRKQISDFIGKLEKPRTDSFYHTLKGKLLKQYIFHPGNIDNAIIKDVVLDKLIPQKLKRQFGYFEDENCKINIRNYEKIHVDVLNGSDTHIDTFFLVVDYPIHKKSFTFVLSIYPSSYIKLYHAVHPVAIINYELFYSGEFLKNN